MSDDSGSFTLKGTRNLIRISRSESNFRIFIEKTNKLINHCMIIENWRSLFVEKISFNNSIGCWWRHSNFQKSFLFLLNWFNIQILWPRVWNFANTNESQLFSQLLQVMRGFLVQVFENRRNISPKWISQINSFKNSNFFTSLNWIYLLFVQLISSAIQYFDWYFGILSFRQDEMSHNASYSIEMVTFIQFSMKNDKFWIKMTDFDQKCQISIIKWRLLNQNDQFLIKIDQFWIEMTNFSQKWPISFKNDTFSSKLVIFISWIGHLWSKLVIFWFLLAIFIKNWSFLSKLVISIQNWSFSGQMRSW